MNKKIFLRLGILVGATSPIAFLVACGEKKEEVIGIDKDDSIQEALSKLNGKKFISDVSIDAISKKWLPIKEVSKDDKDKEEDTSKKNKEVEYITKELKYSQLSDFAKGVSIDVAKFELPNGVSISDISVLKSPSTPGVSTILNGDVTYRFTLIKGTNKNYNGTFTINFVKWDLKNVVKNYNDATTAFKWSNLNTSKVDSKGKEIYKYSIFKTKGESFTYGDFSSDTGYYPSIKKDGKKVKSNSVKNVDVESIIVKDVDEENKTVTYTITLKGLGGRTINNTKDFKITYE